MNKYLKYITFSIIMLLTFIFSVSALDCYYVKDYKVDKDGDGDYDVLEAHFRINENTNKLVFSGVSGYFETSDDSNLIVGETQGVENWNNKFKPIDSNIEVNFSGSSYYSENGKCPPYAILIDRQGQFDLVVSPDETSFDEYYASLGTNGQGKIAMSLSTPNPNSIIRYPSSCLGLNEKSCKLNENFACVWVDNKDYKFVNNGYCNVDNLLYVGCGGATDIPLQVPSLISMFVNLLKIATPIILIFISMITLFKAMTAGKEDEIKKATNSLIKKIIAAAMVFFVVAIVQFIVSKVAEDDEYQGFEECLNCFLNNKCTANTYYKTVIGGEDYCTPLSTGNTDLCNK